MKNLILILVALTMMACGHNPTASNSPNASSEMQLVSVSGVTSFIYLPTKKLEGPVKWVWLAPAFAHGYDPKQMEFYVSNLRAEGFAVVGCDVGESYGSPQGRAAFFNFWNYLKANGFESSGVFLLQSRGGLHGYSFLKEHPSAAKAVAGIYPLLSYDDYAGPQGFAPAWGLSVEDFNLVKSETDPLLNASSFSFPILHLHGDKDLTTSYANSVAFVGIAPNASLITILNQAHEWYSVEIFANETLLQFMIDQNN